ncbi:MAG: hypothetical protein QOE31_3008, partial [Solirubrobacteraceae bacterium]|nr:hypothetical protein [Solirubrobacteraceae bacterium]
PGNVVPLWPAFVEKGLAQLWGGYAKLNGAMEHTIMIAMGTAAPQKIGETMTADLDKQKQAVLAAVAANQLVTAAAHFKRHNYAVLAANDDGITIRDPNTRGAPAPVKWAGGDPPKDTWTSPLIFTWKEYLELFQHTYGARMQAQTGLS